MGPDLQRPHDDDGRSRPARASLHYPRLHRRERPGRCRQKAPELKSSGGGRGGPKGPPSPPPLPTPPPLGLCSAPQKQAPGGSSPPPHPPPSTSVPQRKMNSRPP